MTDEEIMLTLFREGIITREEYLKPIGDIRLLCTAFRLGQECAEIDDETVSAEEALDDIESAVSNLQDALRAIRRKAAK